MSRSGYSYDLEQGALNLYRANVKRTIKGKKGQAFLREMAKSLDEMPDKKLIRYELVSEHGEVCAIGSVCKARGLDISKVDENEPESVAALVGISWPLAAEIAYLNDEYYFYETPEVLWQRMRQWINDNLELPC